MSSPFDQVRRSAGLDTRMKAASLEQLEDWGLAAMSAATIEDTFVSSLIMPAVA